ncbi:MAG: hypothetical protein GY832_03655 [Chloroflexi bacterium]|nr:hypothetical protein [Chloroflexota bacterium]
MPYKFGKAVLFSLVVWIVGFVWGSIIFMTPWNDLPSIPFVSSSPAISFPLLVLMPTVSFFLARSYLKQAEDKRLEGLRFGLTVSVANIVLDLLVIVMLFGGGLGFFASLTVWLGYIAIGVVPYLVGQTMMQPASA